MMEGLVVVKGHNLMFLQDLVRELIAMEKAKVSM